MRLTIIPSDGAVYKNGHAYSDLSWSGTPENVHALQWYGQNGWIEFNDKTPNENISELPGWAHAALLAWDVADTPIIPPPPTLEELKALKNLEINQSRLAANQTTFTYQSKQIACDPLSRSDIDGINGYVATRGMLPPNWVGGWKAIDNSIVPIQTVQDWNSFYDSMIAQGQANFAKSEGLKAQLAAATNAEQVAAIVW